jgi:hypothetical protein
MIKKKRIRQRQVNTGNVEERPKGVLPIIIGKEEIGLASVEYSLSMYDGMSTTLRVIETRIQKTTVAFMDFRKVTAMSMNVSTFEKIEKRLYAIDNKYKDVKSTVSKVENQQKNLNKSIDDGKKKATDFKETWKKLKEGFNTSTKVLGNIGIDNNFKKIFTRASDMKAAGNTIQAKTGMHGPELLMAKQSAKNLYANNIAKSPAEAADSISSVQQMTGKTGPGLEQLTHAGILLQEIFGYGMADSIKTAGMLEQKFGVTGAQALDLIVQGTQAGLNKNGDMLDILNNNSEQFKILGLNGQEMFNMLNNGAQNGNASISSVANAVSEFSSRAISGGAEVQEGFSAIGLNADQMKEAFGSGGESAKEAFLQTVTAINSINDPVSRNAAGMKLFGDSFGELGENGLSALSSLNGSIEISTSHLEELNRVKYDNATNALSALANTVNTGLAGAVGGMVDNIGKKISDFTTGLQGKVGEISGIFGVIGFVAGVIGNTISSVWSVIEPVIWGIVAALIVYNSTSGILWLTTLKQAAVMAWKTICDWAETAAIIAMIVAQDGLNAAFAACPLTWIIMLVILIIALFYAAVAAFNKLAGTSISATGLIFGAFAAAFAFIQNIFMVVCQFIFGQIDFLINVLGAFANFFANIFKDPAAAAIHVFFDMVDAALGAIQKLAKGMDLIFGSDMESVVIGWREDLSSVEDKMVKKYGNGKYEEVMGKSDINKTLEDFGISMDHKSYTENAKKGYDIGAEGGSYINKFTDVNSIFGEGNKPFNPNDYGGNLGQDNQADLSATLNNLNQNSQNNPNLSPYQDSISKNTGDTAASTAAMANTMDSMDEELKYMRDVAEQEIINRFTLADLKLDINNNNNIRNIADAESFTSLLNDTTSEMLYSYAEGVNR